MDAVEQREARRREAAVNFRGWLEWFFKNYPERVRNRTELAAALGVTSGAITQMLDHRILREPSFRVLLAARDLIGVPMDLLVGPPPKLVSAQCPTCGRPGSPHDCA